MTSRVICFTFICLFAASAFAQTQPSDIAREAFYAQAEGDYEKLTLSYDETLISFISDVVKKLVEASKSDPRSKATFEKIFGTTDREAVESLSGNEVFETMFSYLFSSNLSPEEKEVLRGSQFEYVDTSYPDDEHAEVRYVVAFAEDVKTEPKTMLLKKNGNDWRITLRPEIQELIEVSILRSSAGQ